MTTTTRAPSKHKDALSDEERIQRRKEASARYYKNHTSKCVAARKVCRDNNPRSTRNTKVKLKYGITMDQQDTLFASQGSACAICRTPTPTGRGWHVDHCHTTQKVRGVLCHHCNTGLGMFRDNPTALAAAITYLGK